MCCKPERRGATRGEPHGELEERQLPQLIQGPSGYRSEFFYTPERSRWKQQASYGGTSETTVYLGALVEKVTLGTTTAWKHAIQGVEGTVALYTRKSTGTNEVHYLTRDHLGSVTAVTDVSGAVETRLSYAAYGRRRNEASWSGNPSGGEWSGITNTTRHGYTGHEMLDNLDLTHMNGRVYDPRVGRFISADPYIDGALNTQGWNRYAYVKNNPLSAYDPSGFGQEDAGGDCNSSSEAHISNPGSCGSGTSGGSAPSDTFEEVVVHSSRIWDGGGGGSIETVTVSASRGGGLNPLPIDFSNPGSGGGGGSPGRGGGSAVDGTQEEKPEQQQPCLPDDPPIEQVCPECYLMGVGRLAYAALAKVIPAIGASVEESAMAQAAYAGAARNSLKDLFRGPLAPALSGIRQPTFAASLVKYNSDPYAIIGAASRTNAAVNAAGATGAALGVGLSVANQKRCGSGK